jgi:hypothetical protein
MRRDVDGLISEAHNASHSAAKGDCPHTAAGSVVGIGCLAACLTMPVCSDDWSGTHVPTFLKVVSDEIL